MSSELAPILAQGRTRRDGGAWWTAARAFNKVCGSARLDELSVGHVRAVQAEWANFAPSSRRLADYALRRILAAFSDSGAPDLRSAVSITPSPQARQVQPKQTELAKLITTPDLALRFAILCASEAALRTGTTLRVRPQDVQDGYIVTRTKRGMVTKTPVSSRLAALLAVVPPAVDTRQTVFDLLCGHVYMEPDRELAKRWAAWKKRCGVRSELRLHDLRRGLARRVYAATGDLRIVQSLLSHDQLSSTLHYLDAADRRVTPQTLDAAIAAAGDML